MIDLARLIEQDLGPGQRKGAWLFWRCPFHDDSVPSLGVKDGRYHCFGCQASGDAVDWLVTYRRMDKREALRLVKGDTFKPQPPQPEVKADAPPPEEWQVYAAICSATNATSGCLRRKVQGHWPTCTSGG